MMTASQFYVMARRLENAYAAQMRSLCKETGVAQTAMDILLFLHNNPGYDTARDICTYRQLKPALVSLYIENLVQLGFLAREGVAHARMDGSVPAAARAAASASVSPSKGAASFTAISCRTASSSVFLRNSFKAPSPPPKKALCISIPFFRSFSIKTVLKLRKERLPSDDKSRRSFDFYPSSRTRVTPGMARISSAAASSRCSVVSKIV